ncbi:putative TIA1 protein-like protein [Leptotrombidium deliense]|uniref:Putative TIA1 protein-like protein n=1 Tax=Leptotrombidium deliense TaxID=299467 RepID=A0A443SJU1_9ACAR|nr:putative TIA1 protein-like protein [Leptotrombidium deliense]
MVGRGRGGPGGFREVLHKINSAKINGDYISSQRSSKKSDNITSIESSGEASITLVPVIGGRGKLRQTLQKIKEENNASSIAETSHNSAPALNSAIGIESGAQCLEIALIADSATSPPSKDTPTQDTHDVYVGNLGPEIESGQLHNAFAHFGEISNCRVIRETQISNSNAYGFVSFLKHEDALKAITEMNGQQLGSRVIRTNWGRKKCQFNRSSTSCYPNYYGPYSYTAINPYFNAAVMAAANVMMQMWLRRSRSNL